MIAVVVDTTMNNALQVFATGVIFAFLFVLLCGLLFDVFRTMRKGVVG